MVYRCPKRCPIHKNCFILKSKEELPVRITVLFKCPEQHGRDIEIEIGKTKSP